MSGGDRSRAHTALVHDIRLELGQEPGLVLWPAQPGGAPDPTGRPMRAGPVGMADLIGIVGPRGRWLALEVKTGRAKQTEGQVQWGRLVEAHGGVYRIVRSVQDARRALEDARRQ